MSFKAFTKESDGGDEDDLRGGGLPISAKNCDPQG
jgi:hypothetical protein